ncbi:MAG: hypothetical protein WDN69_09140 [Aliidongia sp.]
MALTLRFHDATIAARAESGPSQPGEAKPKRQRSRRPRIGSRRCSDGAADAVAAMRQSFASVNNAVSKLKDLGLVSQVGAGGKERLFQADAVIQLFEVPAPRDRA